MDVTKLPELKEHVSKDEDTSRPVAQPGDESPRQWDFLDWAQPGLSAPPLDERE